MSRSHVVASMATVVALVGLAASGCTAPPEIEPSRSTGDQPGTPGAPEEPICGAPTVVTLLAGQSNDAGTVTIENDAAALCVTLTASRGWFLGATRINIALAAPTGTPAPGSLQDVQVHDPMVTSYVACFSLEAFGYEPATHVYVTAHASMAHITGGVVNLHESGWGHGTPNSGHGWAQYVEHTIHACAAVD